MKSDAEILRGLEEVLEACFPDFDGQVTSDLEPDDVPGWDSTAQVGLIIEVEDKFSVQFEPEEYVFHNVGELIALLRSKV